MNFNFRDVLTVPPDEARKEGMTVSKKQELAWYRMSEMAERLYSGDRLRLEEVFCLSMARSTDRSDAPSISVTMADADDICMFIEIDPYISHGITMCCHEAGTGNMLARRVVLARDQMLDALEGITGKAMLEEWKAAGCPFSSEE